MGEDVANTPNPVAPSVEGTNASTYGRQRGRQNCQRRAFNWPGATPGDVKAPKFEELCDELKGHVYDCSNPRQAADEFTRRTKEIAENTGTT